jgi:anthranilate phosphoribosyltransferase
MSNSNTWPQVTETLTNGLDLNSHSAQWAMNEILRGSAEIAQIKEFLLALKAKGETAEEVNAFVTVMYQHSAPIDISERAVDTVGTGGDGFNTINISTSAAIVAAAAGAKVVKHGNRASSSKSGSADLLEALGVNIDLVGDEVETVFREVGIGFCFAPKFHPAMRFAAPARKELGVPTVFNILR